MGAMGHLRRQAKWLSFLRLFGPKWAGPLSREYIWPSDDASVDKLGRLTVPDLGVTFPDPDPAALTLLRQLPEAKTLRKRTGASYKVGKEEIEVELDGIKLIAASGPDLSTISEIFGECVYRFEMPGPFYVLDIGANIGLAALYFAKNFDARVESFELVPSTATLAQRNIEANPDLAERIALNRYGLADADGQFEIAVDPTCRPSNSLYGSSNGKLGKELVQVKDVAATFREALAKIEGRKLVVKLDAEGAEYEILARLASEGLLGKIDLLILEWHERAGKDPQSLRDLLTQTGFHWTERKHPQAPVGFLNAFRG